MNDRPIEEPKQTRSLGQKGEWETIPFGGHPRVRNREVHNCGHNRGGNWEEDVACQHGHKREMSEEFSGSALKSMGMLRCSKEAARRRSNRTGTRSCVQKVQWSPQAWTDRAKHSQ